jgi:hypothetical protein
VTLQLKIRDLSAARQQLDCASVDPPRFSGWRSCSLRHVLSPVPSTDDLRVCVVCGNQSGRDSAAGRDGVLWPPFVISASKIVSDPHLHAATKAKGLDKGELDE